MCGLAGYRVLSNNQITPDEQLLEKMQKTIEHRGPDGYRTWISKEHRLAFVHRRLSIMDLSDAGFQPMFDAQRTVAVMCNGEIYNHPTLRKELEALGYVYNSHSDTETLVYAYKQWGIDFIQKLEGMFAIIIADLATNETYLIRDRIGIKPLYFSLAEGVLSFASEIKALWPLPWMHREINTQALYHYLTYMATPAPMTLYQGVYKLPAAYYLKVDAKNEITFHEWYRPIITTPQHERAQFANESFCIKNIRRLLRESVQKQMMSDVPYGVFLSGGIDSSLNVALMSELVDQVKTFTVSFVDGPEYSEVTWARKVARKFNTDHHEIIISEKEAFDFFENMVHYQDEPLADCVCIPLYYVSKLLKDAGVTVVQVGEGSDELFCGYSSYAQYIDLYNSYWKNTQKFIPAFAKQGMYQVASKVFPEKFNRLSFVKNWADGRSLFWSGAMAFSEVWKKEIFFSENNTVQFDPIVQQIYPGFAQVFDSYSVVDYHLKQLRKHNPEADFLSSMIYLELKHRLPELLLMRVDKMTMATSVEGRVPFLDHPFVEFALQIPSSLKYKDGVTKYILKKACEGILPNEIIYRKKMGFAAPTSRWFKQGGYFKKYFDDMLHSQRTQWGDYVNFDAVDALCKKNQQKDSECSVQLWVLQNLMANKVL